MQSATPTIFTHEFSLADRVALVSGAHRGIGLEMALAFVEAGARAVYCVDLPKTPDEKWAKVKEFAKGLGRGARAGGEGRLEYISADVRDQVRRGHPDMSSNLCCWVGGGVARGGWRSVAAALLTYSLGGDVEDREDDRGPGRKDGRVRRRGGNLAPDRAVLDILCEDVPRGKLVLRIAPSG